MDTIKDQDQMDNKGEFEPSVILTEWLIDLDVDVPDVLYVTHVICQRTHEIRSLTFPLSLASVGRTIAGHECPGLGAE